MCSKGEIFTLDYITGERTRADGEKEYLAKWHGYPPDEQTWEPTDNFYWTDLEAWEQHKQELEELSSDDDDRTAQPTAGQSNARSQPHSWVTRDTVQLSEENIERSVDDSPDTRPAPKLTMQDDREAPNAIVGETEEDYRVAWQPHPVTGKRSKRAWLDKEEVSHDLIAAWETLKHLIFGSLDTGWREMLDKDWRYELTKEYIIIEPKTLGAAIRYTGRLSETSMTGKDEADNSAQSRRNTNTARAGPDKVGASTSLKHGLGRTDAKPVDDD